MEKASGTIDETEAIQEGADYLMKNGVFEKPLDCDKGFPMALSILDGNHRISAFCGLQETPADYWSRAV